MNEVTETKQPEESLSAKTLKAELMQVVIDELKAAPEVWHQLGENEQDETINRIERRVQDITRLTHTLFATNGVARVIATMDQITVKDGIKAVVSLNRHDPQRHEVVDSQGQTVYLVLANPEQYTDAPHGIKADADQNQIDFDNAMDRIKGDDEEPA